MQDKLKAIAKRSVSAALEEDLNGESDVTAGLVPQEAEAKATIITR